MTRWPALFFCALILTVYSAVVFSADVTRQDREPRFDVIRIDAAAVSGKSERPAVDFPHDLHVDALPAKGSECVACHRVDKGVVSFDFLPADVTDKEEIMNGYHERCIGCHTGLIEDNKAAGPVICSECHRKTPPYEPVSASARFDKSLHQRHTDALNQSCQSCHHVYDEVSKKTVYEKGKEGACVYCHPQKPSDTAMGLEEASHRQCVACHQTRTTTAKTAGPVRCDGCHDAATRAGVRKIDRPARLVMGQKDTLMLHDAEALVAETGRTPMGFVPFDHQNHELKNPSCQVCHHKALVACTTCHTLSGSEKGGSMNLEKVMHDPLSERSCTGCHTRKTRAPECWGCHGFTGSRPSDANDCITCHLTKTLAEDPQAQARDLVQMKTDKKPPVDVATIPETLTLDKLEKRYKPVIFPHRKIVKALADKAAGSRMAGYFHEDKNTLCLSCHHNAPATATPVPCSRCHLASDTNETLNRPGLSGAYHIQCMECHARMNIRQPESCTQCHQEKEQGF